MDDLLDMTESAHYLQMGYGSFQKTVAKDLKPVKVVGRSKLFSKSDLDQWFTQHGSGSKSD